MLLCRCSIFHHLCVTPNDFLHYRCAFHDLASSSLPRPTSRLKSDDKQEQSDAFASKLRAAAEMLDISRPEIVTPCLNESSPPTHMMTVRICNM